MKTPFPSFLAMVILVAYALPLYPQVTPYDFFGYSHDNTDTFKKVLIHKRCEACHIPLTVITTVAILPLWAPSIKTTGLLKLYPSGSKTQLKSGQPSGISSQCLGCHDDGELFSSMLGESHPVSIIFDDKLQLSNLSLHSPTTYITPLGGTIDHDLLFGPEGSRTVECTSCHNPHETTHPKHLIMDNTNSQLCLSCHNK